jgi:hypothetical protein
MTALNAFARPSGAYLLADTGAYHHDGRLLCLQSKVVGCGRLRVAIGYSGRVEIAASEDTGRWLESQSDQATALAGLPEILRQLASFDAEAIQNGAAARSGDIPEGIRLVVAFWDAVEGRGKCALIANVERLSGGATPFTLRPCKTVFSPPLSDDPWPGHSFVPEADALRLAGLHRVGGSFECWRVHAGGVDCTTVCTWPDRVGYQMFAIEDMHP